MTRPSDDFKKNRSLNPQPIWWFGGISDIQVRWKIGPEYRKDATAEEPDWREAGEPLQLEVAAGSAGKYIVDRTVNMCYNVCSATLSSNIRFINSVSAYVLTWLRQKPQPRLLVRGFEVLRRPANENRPG